MVVEDWGYHYRTVNDLEILPLPPCQKGSHCSILSTISCIEARNNFKEAKFHGVAANTALAAQELLDGVNDVNDTEGALRWVARNGIARLRDYRPYDGQRVYGRVSEVAPERRFRIAGMGSLEPHNSKAIKAHLHKYGPLIASFPIHSSYNVGHPQGVYKGEGAREMHADENGVRRPISHSVMIVGYGVNAADEEYWSYQNSYGPGWGDFSDGIGRVAPHLLSRVLYLVL